MMCSSPKDCCEGLNTFEYDSINVPERGKRILFRALAEMEGSVAYVGSV